MTRIKKDAQGLYVQIDGWICRPTPTNEVYAGVVNGKEVIRQKGGATIFKEGDTVRGSHPAGPVAYLRVGKKGTSSYSMEIWPIEDLAPEFKRKEEEAKANADKREAAKVDLAKLRKDLGLE